MSRRPDLLGGFVRGLLLAAALPVFPHAPAQAQGRGSHILYGDVRVEEGKGEGPKLHSFHVILYTEGGLLVSRQAVPNNGRYRFMGLANGHYDVAVEVENREVARVRVLVSAPNKSDFRQDIALQWNSDAKPAKPQTVSAADFYKRPTANQSAFEKAQAAMDQKKYAEAVTLLRRVTDSDAADFQAWTELGTAYLLQEKHGDAEESYRRALEARPTFLLALLNLGRLRSSQKKFEEAVEPLSRAAEQQPASAEAHLLLGEAYLQIRKGSKAVPHLEEAARLGRAEAHLRLAMLYNAAGAKDRAAAEYEQFLSKKPDHPERKKLEQYVKENKKQ